MFNTMQLAVLRYISEEVFRQQDDARFVAFMADAWMHASNAWQEKLPLSAELIERWGMLVSPSKNRHGLRDVDNIDVTIGGRQCPDPQHVRKLLSQLCFQATLMDLEPAEVYQQFEEIRPFRDGNGRVGKIIYNYLHGSLDDPTWPPNFWDGPHP